MAQKQIQDFDGFIFDIDGVILKGDTVIQGAKECIDLLNKNNKKYLFVTNHTKFTKEKFIEKLRAFDIAVDDDQLMTASNTTVDYLKELHPDGNIKVNLIGWGGIIVDFQNAGFTLTRENADYVVVAWDPEYNYESIWSACKSIREGAKFLVTSPDRYIPSERGHELGFGTIGAAITYATGVQPTYVGKPHKPMIAVACTMMGTELADTLIVGDTPETDLHSRTMAGLGASILVLSGNIAEHQVADIPEDQKPTFVLQSVKEFEKYFS